MNRRLPWTIGLVAFTWLAWGVSPAHYWLDSGELTAAGVELGVAHPPGIPGLIPIMHLATIVPMGSLGNRASIFSGYIRTHPWLTRRPTPQALLVPWIR